MRNQFKILFYIKKNQPLRNGKFSIMCRISINGKFCTFSTNLATCPKRWNQARCRLMGRNESARRINAMLDDISYLLYESYLSLMHSATELTPQAVRQQYRGGHICVDGIIALFEKHNSEFEQMVGVTRSRSTLYKYRYVCSHLGQFISEQYGVGDLPIHKIDRGFIIDFHRWLADVIGCCTNTIKIYMTALKHIILRAISNGIISKNPFVGYAMRTEVSHRSFLVKEELQSLMQYHPKNQTESIVLDAFLLSCFTGLAYADILRLRMNNIIELGDRRYIATSRTKTKVAVEVPLLNLPEKIIMRYNRDDPFEPIFSLPSNGHCNNILRHITNEIGIDKRITFHSARHTFATTITLANGVSIEAVSRMLGHVDIKTTQIYAKILRSTISSEMQRISPCIDSSFTTDMLNPIISQKPICQ